MSTQIFATKLAMTQAWTEQGKRLAITRCKVEDNPIISVSSHKAKVQNQDNSIEYAPCTILEVGTARKKLKNMTKPLRMKLEKSGFSFGVTGIKGVRIFDQNKEYKAGDSIKLEEVLSIGDVVKVQGVSKGKGFAGVMKRHGFKGGPRTHGQSDRERAPGAIGNRTDPGRVFKGKKMAGRMGTDNVTVRNLTVVFIDQQKGEVWLNGPIPGHKSSTIRITNTGKKKDIKLNLEASNLINKIEKNKEEQEEKKQDKTSVDSANSKKSSKKTSNQKQKTDSKKEKESEK